MYMQQFLTEVIPARHQRAVLTAITTKPLLHGTWASQMLNCGDEDAGCPAVVAVFAVLGQPISFEEVYRHHSNKMNPLGKETWIAYVLDVTPEQAYDAWNEWDGGTDEDRAVCVEACRQKLEQLNQEAADNFVQKLRAQFVASILEARIPVAVAAFMIGLVIMQ